MGREPVTLSTVFKQFPWRSFRPFLFVFLLQFSFWFYNFLKPDTFSASFLISIGLIAVLLNAFVCALALLPLGEMKRHLAAALNRDERFIEFSGEWSELENTLRDLHKKVERSEQRLRKDEAEVSTLLETVSEAVVSFNEKREIVFSNPMFKGLFPKATHLYEVFRSPEVLKMIDRTLFGKRSHPETVSLLIGDSPSNRVFRVSMKPLFLKNANAPYGGLSILEDVTLLALAEKRQTDLISNVSHELKTPLTILRGYLTTLHSDWNDGRHELIGKYLKVMEKNLERMSSLISDLLDIASLDAGYPLKPKELNLRGFMESITESFHDRLKAKSQKLEILFEVDQLTADPRRLEQVVVNLLDNAMKYSANGETILLAWKKNENGKTDFVVKDRGPGISITHLDRIFERFYRVESDRARDSRTPASGTGLGLAIVKQITERHGGEVSVQSEAGVGTTFIASFPST